MATELRGTGFDDNSTKEPVIAGKKYLLAIGIDNYDVNKGGFQQLKYPVGDAGKFVKLLMDEYGFEKDNIVTLFNEQCEADSIRESIVELKQKFDKDRDQLVVFFAGHGAIKDNIGYWIAFNAKKSIELNLPVSAVLDLLIGCCKQVLLLVDCCFSGATTERAYPKSVFADLDKRSSKFSVITSGNKYEQVPDKSAFMEALLDHLSSKNILNLEELVGDIKTALHNAEETTVTHFSSSDQEGMPFVLQRNDKVSFELTNSFFELNYVDQSKRIAGVRLFNLVYLRGTKECGHHLFSHRYFKTNGANKVNMFNYIPKVITFGRDSQSADYNIWEKIETDFGIKKATPAVIIDKIFKELESRNWVLIVKVDGNCDNQTLQTTLFDFWDKTNEFIAQVPVGDKFPQNKMYVFIWDRRGDSADVIEDKWSKPSKPNLVKIMHLPPVKPLDLDEDLLDWYNSTMAKSLFLNKDETFSGIDIPAIKPPHTIANVICQISDQCKRIEVYDTLFIKKNLWTQ